MHGLIRLSRADAQIYAGVRCSAEVIGIVSCLMDFRVIVVSRVMAGASAALGMVKRHGRGKPRHISTSVFGVQQKFARKEYVATT